MLKVAFPSRGPKHVGCTVTSVHEYIHEGIVTGGTRGQGAPVQDPNFEVTDNILLLESHRAKLKAGMSQGCFYAPCHD